MNIPRWLVDRAARRFDSRAFELDHNHPLVQERRDAARATVHDVLRCALDDAVSCGALKLDGSPSPHYLRIVDGKLWSGLRYKLVAIPYEVEEER